MAESKHLSSHFQAGFWKGYSCEDQILQIAQVIKNGFQKKAINVLY